MCWQYHSTAFAARGTLNASAGPTFFVFDTPVAAKPLCELIVDAKLVVLVGPDGEPLDAPQGDGAAAFEGLRPSQRSLTLTQHRVKWSVGAAPSLLSGILDLSEPASFELRWKMPRRQPASSNAGEAGGASDAADGATEDHPDDQLAAMYEEIMGLAFDACAQGDEPSDEEASDGDERPVSETELPAEAPGPPRALPDDIRDVVLAELASAADDGRRAIAAATNRAAHCSRDPIGRGFISLVVLGDSVQYVRWESTATMEARAVRLDRFDRIIYNIPFRTSIESFAGATLVIHDIPATMQRVTAMYRSNMPDWCVLMRRFHQTQLFSGPLALLGSEADCVVCQTMRRHGHAPWPLAVPDCFSCIACLLTWHGECALALNADVQLHPFTCPSCLLA